MADTIFMMRQIFSEAAYSMLHLLPEKEQKETYGKFVYESGRAAFETNVPAAIADNHWITRQKLVKVCRICSH